MVFSSESAQVNMPNDSYQRIKDVPFSDMSHPFVIIFPTKARMEANKVDK